jgi:hypothetical protein
MKYILGYISSDKLLHYTQPLNINDLNDFMIACAVVSWKEVCLFKIKEKDYAIYFSNWIFK